MRFRKEVLYQKFIRKPFNYVVEIFEKQNPTLKKQTRIIRGRIEVVFIVAGDIKRRISKEGFKVGFLTYTFTPDGEYCFLEVRREWTKED